MTLPAHEYHRLLAVEGECRRLKEQAGNLCFYAVVCPDGEEAYLLFDYKPEGMAAQLRRVVDRPGFCHVFRGERWYISGGPLRHLMGPSGEVIPVYPTPAPERDESGRTGPVILPEDDDTPPPCQDDD